jgi:hypothetical protein
LESNNSHGTNLVNGAMNEAMFSGISAGSAMIKLGSDMMKDSDAADLLCHF